MVIKPFMWILHLPGTMHIYSRQVNMKIFPVTFIKRHDLSLHMKSLNILYPAFNLSLHPWKQVCGGRDKIQSFESTNQFGFQIPLAPTRLWLQHPGTESFNFCPKITIAPDTFLPALCFIHSVSKEIQRERNRSNIPPLPATRSGPSWSQAQSSPLGECRSPFHLGPRLRLWLSLPLGLGICRSFHQKGLPSPDGRGSLSHSTTTSFKRTSPGSFPSSPSPLAQPFLCSCP